MKQEIDSNLNKDIRLFLDKYIKEGSYTDDTNIFKEGFVNSLFAMDLIVFIESNYGFKIGNEDLKIDNFKSVNAIALLIENKLNGVK